MIEKFGLHVDAGLVAFLEAEALPGTGVETTQFWQGFAKLVYDLAPKNRALLAKRDDLQEVIALCKKQIDDVPLQFNHENY